jgi:hypothetical protein
VLDGGAGVGRRPEADLVRAERRGDRVPVEASVLDEDAQGRSWVTGED